MAQVASQRGCAVEVLEVMGGGVMEWRRERDRHLHLHSGYSAVPSASAPGKPASGLELLNLAAVLAKQQLPVNFKVSQRCRRPACRALREFRAGQRTGVMWRQGGARNVAACLLRCAFALQVTIG